MSDSNEEHSRVQKSHGHDIKKSTDLMGEVLHVSPVMPVDEHHIEYSLDQAGMEGALVTSWLPGPWESGFLRLFPPFRRAIKRNPVRLRKRKVVRNFLPDIIHGLSLQSESGHSCIRSHDDFFGFIDQRASRRVTANTGAVIGREFATVSTFRRAKEVGAKCIYHLPTSDHGSLKRILSVEAQQYQGVCRSTFDPHEFDPDRLAIKATEIALADVILCPSEFVEGTLLAAGVPKSKVFVLPFGFERSWLDYQRPAKPTKTVLFVGNISARKGAHRLLEVWRDLGAYRTHRLLLVGDMQLNPEFLRDFAGLYEHVPKMPREDLRQTYLSSDLLILPALAEGFALVLLEAMSCGVTVLASNNSGAAGFLGHNRHARLFEAQDNTVLAENIEWALANPADASQLGMSGRDFASSWTWQHYRASLSNMLAESMAITSSPQ